MASPGVSRGVPLACEPLPVQPPKLPLKGRAQMNVVPTSSDHFCDNIDAGHVMTEYRAESRRHESGEDDRLEAHADAQIRVRNLPVDVRIADFDILGVSPQRAALGALPQLVSPISKNTDALEGIRRNDFHLRTQALQGGEPIIRPVQRSDVAPFGQNLPCAFGLDLDGSGGRRPPHRASPNVNKSKHSLFMRFPRFLK